MFNFLVRRQSSFTFCLGLSHHTHLPARPQPLGTSPYCLITPVLPTSMSWDTMFLLSLTCHLVNFCSSFKIHLKGHCCEGSTDCPGSSLRELSARRGAFPQWTNPSLKAGHLPSPRCLPQANGSTSPGWDLKGPCPVALSFPCLLLTHPSQPGSPLPLTQQVLLPCPTRV